MYFDFADTNCSTPIPNGMRIVRAVTHKNVTNDRSIHSQIENIDENNTSQCDNGSKYFFFLFLF